MLPYGKVLNINPGKHPRVTFECFKCGFQQERDFANIKASLRMGVTPCTKCNIKNKKKPERATFDRISEIVNNYNAFIVEPKKSFYNRYKDKIKIQHKKYKLWCYFGVDKLLSNHKPFWCLRQNGFIDRTIYFYIFGSLFGFENVVQEFFDGEYKIDYFIKNKNLFIEFGWNDLLNFNEKQVKTYKTCYNKKEVLDTLYKKYNENIVFLYRDKENFDFIYKKDTSSLETKKAYINLKINAALDLVYNKIKNLPKSREEVFKDIQNEIHKFYEEYLFE